MPLLGSIFSLHASACVSTRFWPMPGYLGQCTAQQFWHRSTCPCAGLRLLTQFPGSAKRHRHGVCHTSIVIHAKMEEGQARPQKVVTRSCSLNANILKHNGPRIAIGGLGKWKEQRNLGPTFAAPAFFKCEGSQRNKRRASEPHLDDPG